MLTAWDKTREVTLALPDFESNDALNHIRARTRQGELVCPTCHQLLWLRAGAVLVPHFAHRRLSDCPHGRVSEAVLSARRLLYRFFQARIESGKLAADILLEPVITGLPANTRVDLLLRRASKPVVNVVLIERGLKPEIRQALQWRLESKGGVFRPVFLLNRLQRSKNDPDLLLLDTTQRQFLQPSPYDLPRPDDWQEPGTLRFIDPNVAEWTTLRGITLVHDPQVFQARRVKCSKLDTLLWSERYAEWVHPGEAEALRRRHKAIERKKRLEARARRRAEEARRAEARRRGEQACRAERRRQAEARRAKQQRAANLANVQRKPPPQSSHQPTSPTPIIPSVPPESWPEPKQSEPLPDWITNGLVCVKCGQRTTNWQNAAPDKDQCVCKTCFAAGARLN